MGDLFVYVECRFFTLLVIMGEEDVREEDWLEFYKTNISGTIPASGCRAGLRYCLGSESIHKHLQ